MSTENTYRRIFDLVAAKKDGSGSTVQFAVGQNDNSANRCVFLTIAKQKPDTNAENARFDYSNKAIMKLNPVDIGAIMSVLRMREESINKGKGLYHQFEKDGKTVSSSIKLKKNDPKYGGFFFEIMKEDVKIAMPVSNPNAEVLYAFLTNSLFYIYGD